MSEDPEDYDDDSDSYQPKTLTPGSAVLVESSDFSVRLGTVLAPLQMGIIIEQTHEPITQLIIQDTEDLQELELLTTVETFIPYAQIRSVQALQDITEEGLLSSFREDLEAYSEPQEPDQEEDPITLWNQFIQSLNKFLIRLGV